MSGFENLEKINRQNSLFKFRKTALMNLFDLKNISLRRVVAVGGSIIPPLDRSCGGR